MAHTHDVKSLLIAEFNSSRNIVVKKDILKTIEEIEHMGEAPVSAKTQQTADIKI